MRSVLLLLGLLGATACGPTLRVRHLDPTHERAAIHLDGALWAEVAVGGDVTTAIEPGRHELRVVPVGSDASPWHPGSASIELIVEGDAVLTLQPPAKR